MSNFQVLNKLSQLFPDCFATLLEGCDQLTLWIGNTAETAIAVCAQELKISNQAASS